MYRIKLCKVGCGGGAKSVARAVLGIEPNARIEVGPEAKLVTVSGTAGPADSIAQAICAPSFPVEALLAAA